MKKIFLSITLFIFVKTSLAQDTYSPNVAFKWAPTGLILGDISLQAEYSFSDKHSLTAKIGIPVTAHHTFQYEDKDAVFNMKATSFLAGYRTYLSRKKHMLGLYFEPYFKYVHHASEGTGLGTLNGQTVMMNFTNDYNGVGIGAQLGAQFIIGKRFIIDLFFLGPEINSARNNFKSVEVTNTIPWNSIQAQEAERDIRDFINKFPFVKNNTTVKVDQQNRIVTADFNGALPGYRIGVSFGVAL
ncbi:MAG: hypothetical protein C4329_03530 [Chitinophagaceae bacterium]